MCLQLLALYVTVPLDSSMDKRMRRFGDPLLLPHSSTITVDNSMLCPRRVCKQMTGIVLYHLVLAAIALSRRPVEALIWGLTVAQTAVIVLVWIFAARDQPLVWTIPLRLRNAKSSRS